MGYATTAYRHRTRIVTVAILMSALATSSCTDDGCTLEISTEVTPQPFHLTPGESGGAEIRVTTCRSVISVPDWRWESSNPSIAVVDSVSGRITGVAPGQTTVVARSQARGLLAGLVVIVRLPAT